MTVYYLIVFGSLFCLTGSALLALRWALRSGQFQHLSRTALQIFDEEEPVGRLADRFPGGNTPNDSFARHTPAGTPHPSPAAAELGTEPRTRLDLALDPDLALKEEIKSKSKSKSRQSVPTKFNSSPVHPSSLPGRVLRHDWGEGEEIER